MTAGWHAYENESCCTHTGHSFVAACSLASQPHTVPAMHMALSVGLKYCLP